jgi:hypothetical protein
MKDTMKEKNCENAKGRQKERMAGRKERKRKVGNGTEETGN